MTGFRIEKGPFAATQIEAWTGLDPRFRNWPVVYALDGDDQIYVGESLNVATRFRQHLASKEKRHLKGARVVLDSTLGLLHDQVTGWVTQPEWRAWCRAWS